MAAETSIISAVRSAYAPIRVGEGFQTWLPPIIMLLVLLLAPLVLSDFRVSLLANFLTFAILALSLNLIWGYAGMLASATAFSSAWAATPWPCILNWKPPTASCPISFSGAV